MTVPSGAATGNVVVTVNGLAGNGTPYTVTNPPTLTGVTPSEAKPGDAVTISGTGFGNTQGIGQVWLGSTYGTVVSWTDTLVIATVALNSRTGKAQVLQSGVWSNSLPFTVDTGTITEVLPSSGFPGDVVTINGSGFGNTQGSGSVQLGSGNGVVVSWSDTQIVARVAANAMSGIARVQQGGISSNAITFTVLGGSGTSVTLAPNLMNMMVGETRTIQALDPTSRAVTGLTWTSSDATVVSVSSTDPQVLTALAVGHVTITAGSASADVTVWADAMPQGTVLWSNPGNGSGVTKIVPAVPSPTGVADVFAFQGDETVQAITSDGITAWTADVSGADVIPDFQGGLIIRREESNPRTSSIQKLAGQTGQPYPAYTTNVDGSLKRMVVHPDGTIFTAERDYSVHPYTASVIGIDSLTGIRKFSVPLQHEGDWWADCEGYELMIAGDGYAYAPYGYRIGDGSAAALRLLRISSSGAYDTISLPNAKDVWLDVCVPQFHVITNADKGVVVTWKDDTVHMVTTTGVSVGVASPPDVGGTHLDELIPVLQAEDGSFVGTRAWEDEASEPHFTMVAFDENGNVRWSVPGYEPKIATADGGVIAQAWDEDEYDFTGAVVTFDQNGNATGQMASLPTYSWHGDAYRVGSIDLVVANPLYIALSFWPFQGANASGGSTAAKQPVYASLADCTTSPGCIGPREGIYNALDNLISRLGDPLVRDLAQTMVFNKLVNDTSGNPLTTASFLSYLTLKRPHFYDGLKSQFCYAQLTTWSTPCWVPIIGSSITVGDYFKAHPTSDAETGTPSSPLLTFYGASAIVYQNLGINLGNEGLIFHEALHGLTGKQDPTIMGLLGYTAVFNTASCNITNYIQQRVLKFSIGLDPTLYNPGAVPCPLVALPGN
uniref:Cell surface receptor IPT/TIG domain protein n=1 Tax=Solibacter usitatus (strain Ellin6076) TaxID=234267 RepID=Q01V11_SOLUE